MNEENNNLGFNHIPEQKEETIFDVAKEQSVSETAPETVEPGMTSDLGQPTATVSLDSLGGEQPQPTETAPREEAPSAPQTPPTPPQWQNNGGYQQTPPPQGQPYQGQNYYRPTQTPPPEQNPFRVNNQPPRQESVWNVNDYRYQQPQPQQSKSKLNVGLLVFSIILAVALFFTSGAFALYALMGNGISTDTTSQTTKPNVSAPSLELNSRPSENTELTEDGALTDTAIAKKVTPSVVGISTYVRTRTQYQNYGAGSGIILTKDGYIVTNAHVITIEETGELVDRIQVYLDNNQSYSGIVIGSDSRSDLAVIKINAKNLTPAEFGDSTTVEVGEHVLAIGNPSGLELSGSVTDGIVSGVNRLIRSGTTGYSMKCIQTNAAINPGNSGGALVNVYGQVIGINSSKIVAEGYEGIGFAIAVSEAKPIIDSLIANGYVEGRVKIGINYVVIDDFTAALNQVPKGLQVAGIDETLPVAESGLEIYDIITKMDGVSVTTTEEVTEFLKTKEPGDIIKMTVYRLNDDGSSRTLIIEVKLAEDRGEAATNTEEN